MEDIGEETDVAAEHPEIAARIEEYIEGAVTDLPGRE